MKQLVSILLLLFISSFNIQCRRKPFKSVASSYWKYIDEDIQYEIYLKPDGHIYSYHPNDPTPENDLWKQTGNKFYFSMNDDYAHYKGKFINDSTCTGTGKSKGFRWKWTAKLISKD